MMMIMMMMMTIDTLHATLPGLTLYFLWDWPHLFHGICYTTQLTNLLPFIAATRQKQTLQQI